MNLNLFVDSEGNSRRRNSSDAWKYDVSIRNDGVRAASARREADVTAADASFDDSAVHSRDAEAEMHFDFISHAEPRNLSARASHAAERHGVLGTSVGVDDRGVRKRRS